MGEKMTWLNVINKDMKLLEFEEIMVVDRNDLIEDDTCIRSNVNFHVLIHVTDFKYIKIKIYLFGLIWLVKDLLGKKRMSFRPIRAALTFFFLDPINLVEIQNWKKKLKTKQNNDKK